MENAIICLPLLILFFADWFRKRGKNGGLREIRINSK